MGNPAGVRHKKRLKRVKREAERLAVKADAQAKPGAVGKVLARVGSAADTAVKAVGGAMVAAAEKIRGQGEGKAPAKKS